MLGSDSRSPNQIPVAEHNQERSQGRDGPQRVEPPACSSSHARLLTSLPRNASYPRIASSSEESVAQTYRKLFRLACSFALFSRRSAALWAILRFSACSYVARWVSFLFSALTASSFRSKNAFSVFLLLRTDATWASAAAFFFLSN